MSALKEKRPYQLDLGFVPVGLNTQSPPCLYQKLTIGNKPGESIIPDWSVWKSDRLVVAGKRSNVCGAKGSDCECARWKCVVLIG